MYVLKQWKAMQVWTQPWTCLLWQCKTTQYCSQKSK